MDALGRIEIDVDWVNIVGPGGSVVDLGDLTHYHKTLMEPVQQDKAKGRNELAVILGNPVPWKGTVMNKIIQRVDDTPQYNFVFQYAPQGD